MSCLPLSPVVVGFAIHYGGLGFRVKVSKPLRSTPEISPLFEGHPARRGDAGGPGGDGLSLVEAWMIERNTGSFVRVCSLVNFIVVHGTQEDVSHSPGLCLNGGCARSCSQVPSTNLRSALQ